MHEESPARMGLDRLSPEKEQAMRILPLLVLLPLAEIAAFVWIGGEIGAGATLALVVLAAVAGVSLLRRQGVDALRRMDGRLREGRPPLQEGFDALCKALAGLLLFVPGFVTDALALLLLLPPVRRALFARLWTAGAAASFTVRATAAPGPRPGNATVIEGEFVEVRGEVQGEVREGAPAADLSPPDAGRRPPGA